MTIQAKEIVARQSDDGSDVSPIGIVARAAADPNVDADKLAKLYDIQDRHQRREAEISFNRSMMAVQSEVRTIIKNRPNTQTGSDYANIDAILRVLRPCYTKHGFSLSFSTVQPIMEGTIRARGILRHIHGHSEEHFYDCPLDGVGIAGKANKTATHAAASSASYAQRILTVLVFNLSTGYDDDGNAAGGVVLTPAEEKANSWIERARKIETPQQYEAERQELTAAYGDEKKIPGNVKRAFYEAKNAVMPRDES